MSFQRRDYDALHKLPSSTHPERIVLRGSHRSKSSGHGKFLFGLILVLLLVVIGSFGALRIGISSVYFTDAVNGRLNQFAAQGLTPNIGKTILTLDENGLLVAEADAISLINSSTNTPFVQAENMTMRVGFFSLLKGQIDLKTLDLYGVNIIQKNRPTAKVSNNNASQFMRDGLVQPDQLAAMIISQVEYMANNLATLPFEKVTIHDAEISGLADGMLSSFQLDDLALAKNSDGNVTISGQARLQDGAVLPIDGTISSVEDATIPSINVAIANIPFSRQLPKARFDGDEIRECIGRATIGVSTRDTASFPVRLTVGTDDLTCDLLVAGRYEIASEIEFGIAPDAEVFELLPSQIKINRSEFNFNGAVKPVFEQAAQSANYLFEIISNDGKLEPVESEEGALVLSARLGGNFTPLTKQFVLDTIGVNTASGSINGAFSTLLPEKGTDDRAGFLLALRSDVIDIADFKRIWPAFVAVGARKWVMANVFGGRAENILLDFTLPPEKVGQFLPHDEDDLIGGATLIGTRFDTIGDLPPMRGTDLTVTFAGKKVSVEATGGRGYLDNDRSIGLKRALLNIEDTHVRPIPAELIIETEQENAENIAAFIARPPINALADIDLEPKDFAGKATANATLSLVFPVPGEKMQPPDFDASIAFSNLDLAKPLGGQTLTAATGTITANRERVMFDANAELNGLQSKISVIRPRKGSDQKPSQKVTLVLDNKAIAKIAPGLTPFVKGTMAIDVEATSAGAQRFDVDLTKVEIDLPFANWKKGSGIKARAQFDMAIKNGRQNITNLVITGDSLRGKGNLTIEKGQIISADLSAMRLNPNDDFVARIRREGSKSPLNVRLSGASFDVRSLLRKYVKDGNYSSDGAKPAPVAVTGSLKRLAGFSDIAISNAEFAVNTGSSTSLSLTGLLPGGGVRLAATRSQNGQMLSLQAENAGEFLRFADLYKRMRGGALNMDLKPTGSGSMSGPVAITGFSVVGEPKLTSLMGNNVDGAGSLRDAADIDLDLTEARFRVAQANVDYKSGIVNIRNARIGGDSVGFTAEGVLRDTNGQMNLRGTFLPAYGLNKIAGNIPILGALFGAGERRGLIGVTYTLSGPLREPTITINPLSLIAPGVFREIFE